MFPGIIFFQFWFSSLTNLTYSESGMVMQSPKSVGFVFANIWVMEVDPEEKPKSSSPPNPSRSPLPPEIKFRGEFEITGESDVFPDYRADETVAHLPEFVSEGVKGTCLFSSSSLPAANPFELLISFILFMSTEFVCISSE
jgi:hypothetical protein